MTSTLLKTQGSSIIGAQFLNTNASIFLPTMCAKAKGFIREDLEITDQSGRAFAPNITARYQVNRDADDMCDVQLRWTQTAIPVANWNGGATFARYVDNSGLSSWESVEIRSGPNRLQTIYPLELLIYILFWLNPVDRRNAFRLINGGTPAQRSANALGDFEINCPLYTALGLRLHGDPSQGLYIRGLNDYLTFLVKMVPINQVIETDGTLPTEPAPSWYQNGVLSCSCYHVNNDERDSMTDQYAKMPFALYFDDQQYATQLVIPAATALPSTLTFRISNINQPVTALFYVFRWRADLDRVAGGAGGTRGQNLWNIAGWYNAGGGTQGPIIGSLQVRSGNTDILKPISTERLIDLQHFRDFKGDSGVAVPAHSYSHDATAVNASLGFISFEQIDNPQFILNLVQPIKGTAFATVGAASTADIGQNSDMLCDIVAFTKNEIDQANYLLSRPFN